MKKLTYLIAPYSHEDENITTSRLEVVKIVTANLVRRGELVIAPSIHSDVLNASGLNKTTKFWIEYNKELLIRCDRALVLRLPYWFVSEGVNAEITAARAVDITVSYMDPPSVLLNKYKLY